jgi:hypothetical protein
MIDYHCDDSETPPAPDDHRRPRLRRRDRMAYREWVRTFIDDDELRDTYSEDYAGRCYEQLADDISTLLDDDRLGAAARESCAMVSAAMRHLGKRLTAIHDEKYAGDTEKYPDDAEPVS